jgi:beta-1,4-N-acetylglucosaminyltransferase
MIFVTVGTNEAPFHRLLLALNDLRIEEELIVQYGASDVRPSGATCIESVPFEELAGLVRRARLVISHAGVGSVLTALSNGKRPVVVPRLKRFGEAVDDHQVDLARRLHPGLVTLVEDTAQLQKALELPAERATLKIEPDQRLVTDLRGYIGTPVERVGTAGR